MRGSRKINPLILAEIEKHATDDRMIADFLRKLVMEQADDPVKWKELYRGLIEKSCDHGVK